MVPTLEALWFAAVTIFCLEILALAFGMILITSQKVPLFTKSTLCFSTTIIGWMGVLACSIGALLSVCGLQQCEPAQVKFVVVSFAPLVLIAVAPLAFSR